MKNQPKNQRGRTGRQFNLVTSEELFQDMHDLAILHESESKTAYVCGLIEQDAKANRSKLARLRRLREKGKQR